MAALELASDRPDPSSAAALGRVLAGILAAPHHEGMVLGLHGAWGSGKSTVMGAIAKTLRADLDHRSVFVEFNAWKFQEREALWRALIITVLSALRTEIKGWPGTERATKEGEIDELERSLYASFTAREKGGIQVNWTGLATEGILTLIRIAAGGWVSGVIGGAGKALRSFFDMKDKGGSEKDVAGSVERVAGILHREVVERSVAQVQAIDQFLDRYRRLVADLGRSGKRIYIMVDDLDRCLPDEALTIFEAIKLFLDAPECRYVIAIDRSMIRRGLEIRYERSPQVVDPDEYIEKTISLSFDLPQLQVVQARRLLRTTGLKAVATAPPAATDPDHPQDDPWHTAIIETLGTNPRRLKRAANTLRVMHTLATEGGRTLSDHDSALLLKLGLIAYRNSGVFDAVRRDPKFGSDLQKLAHAATNQGSAPPPEALPVPFRNLANDNGFWVLLRRPPDLTEVQIIKGAAWFEPAIG